MDNFLRTRRETTRFRKSRDSVLSGSHRFPPPAWRCVGRVSHGGRNREISTSTLPRSARRIRVRKIDDKPRHPKTRDGRDSFRLVLCVKCRHCHIEEVATGSVLSRRNRGVKLQSKVSWRVMQFNSACFKKLVQNEHEFVILLKNSPCSVPIMEICPVEQL